MPQRIASDTCSETGCDRPRARKTNGTRRSRCEGHEQRARRGTLLTDSSPIRAFRAPGSGGLSSYGYWLRFEPTHPLAFANGHVLVHRAVLYDAIGPGQHECHWCRTPVEWRKDGLAPGALVADHVDGDRQNNEPANLVPSCQPCNSARSNYGNPTEWARPGAST